MYKTLYYRLKEQTFDDQIEYSNIRAVQLPSSSIRTSVLQDVHPNPAEDQLFIPFYIHSETEVISADIYDIQGRLVMQLVQNQQFSVGKQTSRNRSREFAKRGLYPAIYSGGCCFDT